MNKTEAKSILLKGYVYAFVGFIAALLVNLNIDFKATYYFFLFPYVFWSIYWGYKIAYNRLKKTWNSPVHITAKNGFEYMTKTMFFKFTREFIYFWICYIVGAFGGAIYKQIQLSRIAYF